MKKGVFGYEEVSEFYQLDPNNVTEEFFSEFGEKISGDIPIYDLDELGELVFNKFTESSPISEKLTLRYVHQGTDEEIDTKENLTLILQRIERLFSVVAQEGDCVFLKVGSLAVGAWFIVYFYPEEWQGSSSRSGLCCREPHPTRVRCYLMFLKRVKNLEQLYLFSITAIRANIVIFSVDGRVKGSARWFSGLTNHQTSAIGTSRISFHFYSLRILALGLLCWILHPLNPRVSICLFGGEICKLLSGDLCPNMAFSRGDSPI